MRFDAAGYVTEYWGDAPDPFSQTFVDVEAMHTVTVDAELARLTPLLGSVLHFDGSPAVGYEVRIFQDAPDSAATTARITDASGDVGFDVPPGMYYVSFTTPDGAPLGWWDGDNIPGSGPLALIADGTGTPLHFHVVVGLADDVEPECPTATACDEPGTEEPNPEEPSGGATVCRDDLGQPIECMDPVCRDVLGQPVDCDDTPSSSTVSETPTPSVDHPDRLATTGAGDWAGAGVIALALLLVGAGAHVSTRLHERRMSKP